MKSTKAVEWSFEPRQSVNQHRRIRSVLVTEMPKHDTNYGAHLKDLNLSKFRAVLSNEMGACLRTLA